MTCQCVVFAFLAIFANPYLASPYFGDIDIKTSATASSYVFLQQELARGLRLSQPSCVAKDAAWRALGFAVGNLSPAAKRCLTADAVVRCAAAELARRRQRQPQHSERERGAVAAKRANTR